MSESYLCFAAASSDSARWRVGETGVVTGAVDDLRRFARKLIITLRWS